ncbi:uncharacterized protein C20orf144 homolog [Dromiciops gliroides]|uniref:uncharacterized protein C20orf144 homolog n=1 Tax=Dromiciops gliroides TaxID=33562 RepID=UPI001CC3618F|nr:uncharacterized protein C20orf144 homolog [Dromiciops gliroides]
MGNYNSRKKTKAPKQGRKEKPPEMEKAKKKKKPFFGRLKKKSSPKIVLLLPLDKRNQLAETSIPPGSWAGRPEDEAGTTATPAASSLRGAGDGMDRQEGSRAHEMKKILVFLLLLDARLQDEWWGVDGSTKSAQAWQHLYSRLLAENETEGEIEDQPRPQRRWHWTRYQC